MSPLDNHMVSNQPFSSSLGGRYAAGLNGRVTAIPAGWTKNTIMVGSGLGMGLQDTMMAWGELLLRAGNKTRQSIGQSTWPGGPGAGPTSTGTGGDPGTARLQYYTSNGAH